MIYFFNFLIKTNFEITYALAKIFDTQIVANWKKCRKPSERKLSFGKNVGKKLFE